MNNDNYRNGGGHDDVELNKLNEKSLFKDEKKTKEEPVAGGCCRSKHTKNCCIATGIFGGLFLILGVVVMLTGKSFLEKKIKNSLFLGEGSDIYKSWLNPPVQPHLEAYAFSIQNPEEVKQGEKPILKEVGPFIYKAVTLKDTENNVKWWDEDGTLTYRPRKIYTYEKAMSDNRDPDTTMITVPNIPWWTVVHKYQQAKGGMKKGVIKGLFENNGLNEPFIEVSFSGLLWGYEDDLTCLKLDKPSECGSDDPFLQVDCVFDCDGDGDDDGDDDSWDDDWKRKKRSVPEDDPIFKIPKDSEYEKLVRPKAEFVNCSCQWGLFRDRNVTMRKPLRIITGENDISKKGVVTKFNGKDTHEWWKKGSMCDKVKGQDSSTLPPGLVKDQTLEIFIALMCRTIKMDYEKVVQHANIDTYRFIPPINALGRHDDTNETLKNPENECYCLEGFRCLKSGVMSMEPCKIAPGDVGIGAPVALSMPHFYQADPSLLDTVVGLKPQKEKHEFYMDVVPELGFPLAIRPRFQLNVVIKGDSTIDKIAGMEEEDLVMPFLWAQDGFDEPSKLLADKVKFGIEAPEKLPILGAVVLFVIGAILLLTSLAYFLWVRRSASHTIKDSS